MRKYAYVCMKRTTETATVTGVFSTLKKARKNKPKGGLWQELWRFKIDENKTAKARRLPWVPGGEA